VHNFQLLTNAVGKTDGQLASFVDSSNANFRAIASQDAALRESLRLLPPTLQTASTTFTKADRLAVALGSSTQALRPAARALGPALVATRPFLEKTTPIIKNQLRPFARGAQGPVKDLQQAAAKLGPTTPHLVNAFKVLNALLNTLAYDAPGADESYLFYNAWLNHNAASLFSTQDANGPIRRGLFLASCSSLGVLQQIGQTNPNLQVLIDLLNAPQVSQVCPSQLTSKSARGAVKSLRSHSAAPRNLKPSRPKAGSGGTGTTGTTGTTPAPRPQQGQPGKSQPKRAPAPSAPAPQPPASEPQGGSGVGELLKPLAPGGGG
jgi:phospholipid/cholesterol/gamma-HCH transport system substrate-binding protein